jgi:hypothetical protein
VIECQSLTWISSLVTFVQKPTYEYVLYIDEAGDPGIERVRPIDPKGSTEWFVLAGSLYNASEVSRSVSFVKRQVTELRIRGRGDMHFRELSDGKKKLICSALSEEPSLNFVVASNKRNMRKYRNARAAAVNPGISSGQVIYNYCTRLLLERVSDHVLKDSNLKFGEPKTVRVVFSKRGGHNYPHLFGYLKLARYQSIHGLLELKRRDFKWQVLDDRLFETKPHWFYEGLQVADVVASSFYRAIDVLDVQQTTEFADILIPTLAKENEDISDYGLKLLPEPEEVQLLPRQKEIFLKCGYVL